MLEVHHLQLNTLDTLLKSLTISPHLILDPSLFVFQLRNNGMISDVFLPQILNQVLHFLIT